MCITNNRVFNYNIIHFAIPQFTMCVTSQYIVLHLFVIMFRSLQSETSDLLVPIFQCLVKYFFKIDYLNVIILL